MISSTDAAVGVVAGELRVLVADHLVGPVEQLLAVFLRHAHQTGDRLQRQLAGHLLDEVAGALGRGRLGDVVRPFAESSRSDSTARGVNAARDDLAQVGVMRCVHVEQDELARLERRRRRPRRGSAAARSSLLLENTSLRRDTSLTSLCLVTTQ